MKTKKKTRLFVSYNMKKNPDRTFKIKPSCLIYQVKYTICNVFQLQADNKVGFKKQQKLEQINTMHRQFLGTKGNY